MKNNTIYRLVIVLVTFCIFYVPYLAINHLPLQRHTIPYIFHEEEIPLLGWSAWIYMSVFVQGVVCGIFATPKVLSNTVFLGAIIVGIHCLIFLIYPTEYPRADYPSDDFVLGIFRCVDTPANCLPSLHVSATTLFAFAFSQSINSKMNNIALEARILGFKIKIYRNKILIFSVYFWSVLIMVSTLTTKQHYLLDVFSGVLVVALVLIKYKKYL